MLAVPFGQGEVVVAEAFDALGVLDFVVGDGRVDPLLAAAEESFSTDGDHVFGDGVPIGFGVVIRDAAAGGGGEVLVVGRGPRGVGGRYGGAGRAADGGGGAVG